MSNGRLNIDLEFEGLSLLSEAMLNAPEQVVRFADRAGREALPILRDSIGDETPYRTGFLLRSESVSMEGPFNLLFAAGAPYARAVNARNPFVERGTENASAEVDAIYERAFDDLASGFGEGI